MANLETRKVVCQFCHARCRVLMHIQDGHLVKVEEDTSYPRAGTVYPPTNACFRLRGAKEWMYHPDRVNYPLKRVGERGEGKWQQISWEQAFDEIAEKLQRIKDKYGPEAIGITTGTGRTQEELTGRFANTLGTPNLVGSASI